MCVFAQNVTKNAQNVKSVLLIIMLCCCGYIKRVIAIHLILHGDNS